MTAAQLRSLAREAMLASGARGFMRFTQEGDDLLCCDAAERCADGGAALIKALGDAGFCCRREGGLLYLSPGDALLSRLCARETPPGIDWTSGLHPAQAFAARLLREERAAMTPRGRAFAMHTARLLWQGERQVLGQLPTLRAEAALLLREGDRTGFAIAGAILMNWCEQAKGDDPR